MGNDVQAAACLPENPTCNDGICGSANAAPYWQSPTPTNSVLCSKGTVQSLTRATNRWTWTCKGYNPDGASVACSTHAMPLNGTCGTAHGKLLFSAPSGGVLCGPNSPLVGSEPS